MLGATLIFVWVAHRAKYRPSALLLSAALVMALTSFHPVRNTDETGVADDSSVTEDRSWRPFRIGRTPPADESEASADDSQSNDDGQIPPTPPDPPDVVQADDYSVPAIPDAYSVPSVPDQVTMPSYVDVPTMPVDVHVQMITPEAMRRMMSPEMIQQMMTPEDRAALERERAQLQIAIIQMRRQLRDEARRIARKRYY
jgi:hypothetical protein